MNRGVLAQLALLGCLLAVPPVGAAPPTPAEKARARQLSSEAAAAFRAAKYEYAIAKLRAARALDPAPVQLFVIGRSLEELGKLEPALRHFEEFRALAATAQDKARTDRRIAALKQRISMTLTWLVVRRTPADGALTVDGKVIETPGATVTLRLKPGEHTVRLEATGFVAEARRVRLAAGTTRDLELTLTRRPTKPHFQKRPIPIEPGVPDRTAEWSLLGSGGALVLVGVGLTIGSLIEHGKVDDADGDGDGRSDSVTQSGAEDARSLGNGLGTAAWISYGVGTGLLVAGVVLWLVDDPPSTRPSVQVGAGGAIFQLGGRF